MEDTIHMAIETPAPAGAPDAPAPVVATGNEDRVEVSLQQGEQSEGTQDRPEWLPEKFQSAEDLAKAYAELERKLGQGAAAPESAPAPPTETPAAPAEETVSAAVTEAVLAAAGGEETLNEVVAWAKQALPQADREAFDAALDTGNPALARMAMAQVVSAYRAANPAEPALVRAEPAPAAPAVKGFGSPQELARAMSDPRYGSGDPAYHAEIYRRVAVTTAF
jgi:hypothetical protein